MLSKEMNDYISLALGDELLEVQEMEFLKRKAQEFGDDPIEVEMTVKNLLAQIKKKSDIQQTKCPNCGAFMDQLTQKCGYCGFEKCIKVQDSFSSEEFSKKLNELTDEAFKERKPSVFSRIIKIVKMIFIAMCFIIFFTGLSKVNKYLNISKGKIQWYPDITTYTRDNSSYIAIIPKTEEQKNRAEKDGELIGKIRWENMNTEERQEYKEMRVKEISMDPYEDLLPDTIMFLIGLLIILTFILPPKKSVYQKQLENDILMYSVPSQRQAVFDLCLHLASKIEPINKLAFIFTKNEKIKARQNQFWTKKIKQIYEKAKLSFKKEPQVINQLKDILGDNNVYV